MGPSRKRKEERIKKIEDKFVAGDCSLTYYPYSPVASQQRFSKKAANLYIMDTYHMSISVITAPLHLSPF